MKITKQQLKQIIKEEIEEQQISEILDPISIAAMGALAGVLLSRHRRPVNIHAEPGAVVVAPQVDMGTRFSLMQFGLTELLAMAGLGFSFGPLRNWWNKMRGIPAQQEEIADSLDPLIGGEEDSIPPETLQHFLDKLEKNPEFNKLLEKLAAVVEDIERHGKPEQTLPRLTKLVDKANEMMRNTAQTIDLPHLGAYVEDPQTDQRAYAKTAESKMKITKSQLHKIIKEELEKVKLEELNLSQAANVMMAPFRWLRNLSGGALMFRRALKRITKISEKDRELLDAVMDRLDAIEGIESVDTFATLETTLVPLVREAMDELGLSPEDRAIVAGHLGYIFGVDIEAPAEIDMEPIGDFKPRPPLRHLGYDYKDPRTGQRFHAKGMREGRKKK